MAFSSVYIVFKDEEEASRIGEILVNERLIACINYFPVKSIYRWQGRIEQAGEIAAICKTRAELVGNVIRRVKELHSYRVPCIVSWIIEQGDADYLNWIRDSTGEEVQ
ncbi:MAG: divalent-cation tolerance protein CutA [Dehalococcoidales bacterium]|nr:divalent-cation tolerance protein CutA [Dehalococcoidales bacterium]